jgi:hypothetical protein
MSYGKEIGNDKGKSNPELSEVYQQLTLDQIRALIKDKLISIELLEKLAEQQPDKIWCVERVPTLEGNVSVIRIGKDAVGPLIAAIGEADEAEKAPVAVAGAQDSPTVDSAEEDTPKQKAEAALSALMPAVNEALGKLGFDAKKLTLDEKLMKELRSAFMLQIDAYSQPDKQPDLTEQRRADTKKLAEDLIGSVAGACLGAVQAALDGPEIVGTLLPGTDSGAREFALNLLSSQKVDDLIADAKKKFIDAAEHKIERGPNLNKVADLAETLKKILNESVSQIVSGLLERWYNAQELAAQER